ncbi:MAG: N-acetylmuramoyl-L-alanine amidase [Lachnospiraceae bacterium]
MYDELMKRTAIYGSIIAILIICILGYCINNRNIRGSSITASKNAEYSSARQDIASQNYKELQMKSATKDVAYLEIPLSANTTEEQILLKSDYMEHTLHIMIEGLDENFYEKSMIEGNSAYVDSLSYHYNNRVTELMIHLTDIYEYTAFYKNNMLYLEFELPRTRYHQLLVIDAGNQESSDDLTPMIAQKLKDRLAQTEIKVYDTCMDTENPSVEKRVAFANQIKADMLISIQVRESVETSENMVQTIYHPTFFIPYLSSIELSNIVEREVAKSIGCQGKGLIAAGKQDVIANRATVPAAMVELGHVTDREEAKDTEAYADKVAEGLYNSILAAYSMRDSHE